MAGMSRDDLGATLTLAAPPRSIVSLVPSLTELVAVWGLASRLVGVTDYCVSPSDAFPDAERVRGTKNPDTRRIIELRPDLVLADKEESRRMDVERLREAGLAVWVTSVRSVRDVAASVRRLGPVLGVGAAGEDLAHRILDGLDRPSACGPDGRPLDLTSACMIWRDGPQHGSHELWWGVGPETYAGDLLRCAGLPPVVVGGDGRYPRARLDELRRSSPSLVLLPDEPYEFGVEDAAVFEGWPSTVLRCSGQPLFWWGHRTPDALRWLREVRNDCAQDSVRRANPRSA